MKPLKQLMLGLLCLTVNLAPLGAWTQDEAGLIEETDPWPSNPPSLVRIANNLLTVKVHDASVEELVEEIARQSGLNIVWYGTISERITLDFQGLALDQALARILRLHSFALASAQGGEGEGTAARPRKLWIIPKGAEGSPPQAAAANESERDDVLQDESLDITLLIAALRSEDSWEREEAVEALGEIGGPESAQFLGVALTDEDEDVRQASIAALAHIGGDRAAQVLAVALEDEDEWFREEAVEALGEIGGNSAIRLLEQALSDEYDGVRDTAEELLEELRQDSSEP
jgi:HEAT repeats